MPTHPLPPVHMAARVNAGGCRPLPPPLLLVATLLAAAALFLTACPATVQAAETPKPTPTPTPVPPPSPWTRPPVPRSPQPGPLLCQYHWQMERQAFLWRRYFASKGASEAAQVALQTRLIKGYTSIMVKRDSLGRPCMWRHRYIEFFDKEFERAMKEANLTE